jgi:hypothetical protein
MTKKEEELASGQGVLAGLDDFTGVRYETWE